MIDECASYRGIDWDATAQALVGAAPTEIYYEINNMASYRVTLGYERWFTGSDLIDRANPTCAYTYENTDPNAGW
jgi:hypothetical protein